MPRPPVARTSRPPRPVSVTLTAKAVATALTAKAVATVLSATAVAALVAAAPAQAQQPPTKEELERQRQRAPQQGQPQQAPRRDQAPQGGPVGRPGGPGGGPGPGTAAPPRNLPPPVVNTPPVQRAAPPPVVQTPPPARTAPPPPLQRPATASPPPAEFKRLPPAQQPVLRPAPQVVTPQQKSPPIAPPPNTTPPVATPQVTPQPGRPLVVPGRPPFDRPPIGGTPGTPGTISTPGGVPPGQPPGTRPGVPGGVPPVANPTTPPAGTPFQRPGQPAAVPPGFRPPGPVIGAPRPGTVVPGRIVPPAPGPQRFDDVRSTRIERTDTRGRRFFEEPGNRTLIRQDNRVLVHRNEFDRLRQFNPNARSIRRPGGINETFYIRPDGVRVITEFDSAGRIVRRYGRRPGYPDIVYLDNRRFYRNAAIGVGIAAVGIGIALALAPPVVAMPRERYIVEYDRASDDVIYETLTAPPIEQLPRRYSLDEVRYNHALRERMRRVDLDTITFEFGSFDVTEDQYPKLERLARAIGRAVEANPAEVFLIEGHTDAVGSEEDNASLSDRRAEAVARVLSEYYSIPMENLVTQGYGEQYLKVPTQEAERANRRVTARRISPLLEQGQQ